MTDIGIGPAGAQAPEEDSQSGWATFFHISRFHIIVIAMAACLTFGWIFTGGHDLLLPLIVGFDWFIVNLLNRVVDLPEDRLNKAVGTGFVDRHAKALSWLCYGTLILSFPLTYLAYPELTSTRVIFQIIGFAYNFKLIPTPRGLTRFKELYFFKNVASGILFLISGILYPIIAAGKLGAVSPLEVALMMAFFLAMDLTYEIIYDLRDLEGDRAENVPTFPVAHGPRGARRIIIGLLGVAATTLLIGYGAGVLIFAEVVMIAAVFQQGAFLRWRVRDRIEGGALYGIDRLNQDDCVFVTYLGAAQLLSFNVWVMVGLPLDLTAL